MSTLTIRSIDSAQASAFRALPHKVQAVEGVDEVLISRNSDGTASISVNAFARFRNPNVMTGIVSKHRRVRVGNAGDPVRAVVQDAIELSIGSMHDTDQPFVLITCVNHAAVLVTAEAA